MSAPAVATATEGATRIILVHGTGHGGWCWYRVATLLRAAGHRVHAPDLAASGIDARQLRDAPTFEDYTRPLLDALRALPPGARAVLVGHSFGGINIALAAEMFPEKPHILYILDPPLVPTVEDYTRPLLDTLGALPPGERAVLVGHSFGGINIALASEIFPEKVAAAVFVTAFLPDCTNPRPHVIQKVPVSDWMDTVMDAEHVPPTVSLGPEFRRQMLYPLSPPEDYTLSQSLVRAGSFYVADLLSQPPFSEARYGAVTKVYVVCKQDNSITEAYQYKMIAGCPVAEVREIANADHMPMFSAPAELAGHLADIASSYA